MPTASEVWNQKSVPVVLRRPKGLPLRLRLPWNKNNRWWLKADHRGDPTWVDQLKCWETPKAWLNQIVDQALIDFSQIWIIQPYREMEKCAPACMNAMGHECNCSCMGANHGAGNDGSWFEVTETFAFKWGEEQLACRLLTRKNIQVFQNLSVDA